MQTAAFTPAQDRQRLVRPVAVEVSLLLQCPHSSTSVAPASLSLPPLPSFHTPTTLIMGNLLSNYVQSTLDTLSLYFWNKPCRVIITGLDAAGKTTLLYRIKLGEIVTTIPTIGFNVETFVYKNVEFTAWDIGGQDRLRPLWRHYVQHTDAVIYVVDAGDRGRVGEAAEELHRLFQSDELRDTKLLVYANKQDLPGSMSLAEVQAELKLDRVTKNPRRIVGSAAILGEGIYEGLDWLSSALLGGEWVVVDDEEHAQ